MGEILPRTEGPISLRVQWSIDSSVVLAAAIVLSF